MNALFLGGNSPRHQTWIHEMANELSAPFETSIVHNYKHWATGDPGADIDYEKLEISAKMADLEPYIVFAKSIGSMIALKAIFEGHLKPKACVFLGLPLNAITDMNLPAVEWLSGVKVPIYFLHNDNDPYGSAEQLRATVPENIDQANIIVIPGDTHDYNDVAVMADLLAQACA